MEKEHQPNSNSNIQGMSMGRRQFISYLLGFSILATLGGVLTPIIGYLWPPARSSSGGGGRVQVGTTAEIPVGQGKVFPVNNKPVIVVNTEQGGFKAFSAICTHLGCIVEWDEGREIIRCPCHDGRFNAVNGSIISGPQPSPLAEFELSVEGDAVYVIES